MAKSATFTMTRCLCAIWSSVTLRTYKGLTEGSVTVRSSIHLVISEAWLILIYISDKNYWVSEDKQIEMMENIEFLCQAFDSIKLADINKQLNDLETDKQADFVVQTIDDHKQKETARTEALNEKLKVDKAKDTIKSGGWSVNDVQLVCSIF